MRRPCAQRPARALTLVISRILDHHCNEATVDVDGFSRHQPCVVGREEGRRAPTSSIDTRSPRRCALGSMRQQLEMLDSGGSARFEALGVTSLARPESSSSILGGVSMQSINGLGHYVQGRCRRPSYAHRSLSAQRAEPLGTTWPSLLVRTGALRHARVRLQTIVRFGMHLSWIKVGWRSRCMYVCVNQWLNVRGR